MVLANQYLRHELIEEREYQINIAKKCIEKNTLVVLPTSIGKTMIALIVIADHLQKTGANPNKKALFLTPTKPLAVQQYKEGVLKFLNIEPEKVALFTGEISWKKRSEIWKRSVIVVSTPQVIMNDILAGRINMEDVALVIFDEAHRAVGNYDYVGIGMKCREYGIRTMGLTASPGHDKDKIMEVCTNININWAEIRFESDPDVCQYVHAITKHWVYVTLPPGIEKIRQSIQEALNEYVKVLNQFGFGLSLRTLTEKRIAAIEHKIDEMLRTKKESSLFTARSIMASVRKIKHALQLIETQGVRQFLEYYENKLLPDARESDASRASRSVAKNPKMLEAVLRAKECREEHPKLSKIKEIVENQLKQKPDSRILIFAEVRETVSYIAEVLKDVPGVRVSVFVGQAAKKNKKGMRQKEQIEVIEKFRKGEYNVLSATSVAEEGLDIPSVDMVIFYEPVGSEKRMIQRRGRTGRRYTGMVYFLIAQDTMDVHRQYASIKMEQKMRAIVKRLQEDFMREEQRKETKTTQYLVERKPPETDEVREHETRTRSYKTQPTLYDFHQNDATRTMEVLVDRREMRSPIPRLLSENGVHVIYRILPVGDYQVSEEVIVERKRVEDFVNSILDGRLFQQAKELYAACAHPIIIVEGNWNGYTRCVSKSAVYGAVSALAVDFGLPVLNFENENESTQFLLQMIKRINGDGRVPKIRFEKKPRSMAELQEYLIAGLPDVSTVLSRRLLECFKTPLAVFNAGAEELAQVKGLGMRKAQEIVSVLRSCWDRNDGY